MMKQRSRRIVGLSSVEYGPNHMTPLRRLGQPIEIANAVLVLASDEASYITGVTLDITGFRFSRLAEGAVGRPRNVL